MKRSHIIDTPEALNDLCEHLKHTSVIALDTEFLREKTYYAQLCLLQVASEEVVACVDPIRLTNFQPLLDILYDPSKVKVMHSARQDLEILYDAVGELPQNIFDTQIAATLLGYGDQLGYANLVQAVEDVSLEKSQSRTDWSKRPLDEKQINYALEDVEYLIPIYKKLKQALGEKGRADWLKTDFEHLSCTSLYAPSLDAVWKRVRGVNSLKGVQLAVAQRLAYWREIQARDINRPRRWVMSDELMIDLCRRMPNSADQLEKLRSWHNGVKRHSRQVLQEIECAKNSDSSRWPRAARPYRLNLNQEAIVDALMSIVRLRAEQNQVAPALLVSRKNIEHWVAMGHVDELLSGWRAQLVGNELRDFINGKYQIKMKDGKIYLE